MKRANDVDVHVQRLIALRALGSDHARQTVMYLSGVLVDNMSSLLYTFANPIVRSGADVILCDVIGHGRSERPPTGYPLEDTLTDLDILLDALNIDHPVHLVGNSYGGTVTLGYALARPERVASAVLIDAHYSVEGLHVVDTMPPEIRCWLDDDATPRKIAALRTWSRAELRSITCPVLAVYGGCSDIIDRPAHLLDVLPNCRVTILPGCTRFVALEGGCALRDEILRWVAEQRTTLGRVPNQ